MWENEGNEGGGETVCMEASLRDMRAIIVKLASQQQKDGKRARSFLSRTGGLKRIRVSCKEV